MKNNDKIALEALQALLSGDIEKLMELDKQLDMQIEHEKNEIEAACAADPELALFIDVLTNGKGIEAFAMDAAKSGMGEAEFIELLNRNAEKAEKSVKKTSKQMDEKVFARAKASARAKNPEYDFFLGVERQILKGLSEQDQKRFLLDKYSSLKDDMLEELGKAKAAGSELAFGIAGGLSMLDIVIEDLEGLLK